MITRDLLQKMEDFKVEKLEIPEWKDFIYVRSLSGEERDKFESSMYSGRGKDSQINMKNLRARLVVLAACNENGKRIFKDTDIEWLGKKNASALTRIFVKAQELAGLKDDDVEELAKNSENPQNGNCTSEFVEN